jgi:hypothetical protein
MNEIKHRQIEKERKKDGKAGGDLEPSPVFFLLLQKGASKTRLCCVMPLTLNKEQTLSHFQHPSFNSQGGKLYRLCKKIFASYLKLH